MNAITITESSHDNGSLKATRMPNEGIALSSAKYEHVKPHDYQIRLTEEIVTILQTSQHAYLEAPTATGKTLVLALIADQLGISDVNYMVNTTELVDQTKQEIESMIYAGLINPKTNWNFMTWQAYVAMVKRRPAEDPLPEHLALVDECHIGGVKRSGKDKVSFPLIKETATKVLWISATPWNLDETMMGGREGNTAYYSYNAAFARGSLNQTQLIRVDCSLNMKLKLNDESPTVRELVAAQTETMNIEGETAEQTFDELERYVQELLGRPLKTTDVPSLVKHRYMLMAEIYRSKHPGEKAVFWLPNQRYAKDCADYLNNLFNDPSYAGTFLGDKTQSAEEKRSQETLKSFKNLNGKVKVICVVYRLRAGFDYPQLANGFDCAWNPYNYRNAVQKIGRLVRTAAAKPTGNYYYAVDAVAIAAAANRNFAAKFLGGLKDKYSPEDLNLTANALADAKAFDEELQPNTPSIKSPPKIEVIALPRRYITTAGIELFNVIDASRSIERASIDLTQIFSPALTEATNAKVEESLRRIERGESFWGRGDPDYEYLKGFTIKTANIYRQWVRDRLIACNSLRSREQRRLRREAAIKNSLNRMLNGMSQWREGDVDYERLTTIVTKSSRYYQPEIREQLEAAGIFKPRITVTEQHLWSSVQGNDTKISELLAQIEAGTTQFDTKHPLYRLMAYHFTPSSTGYRPELRRRLVDCGVIKEKAKVDEKIEDLLVKVEKGEIPFDRKNEASKYLLSLTYENRTNYRPHVRNRLEKAGKIVRLRKHIHTEIDESLNRMLDGTSEWRKGDVDYERLKTVVKKSSKTYKHDIRERLEAAGVIEQSVTGQHLWSTTPGTDAKISHLLAQIEAGTIQFDTKHPLYSLMAYHFTPSSTGYRPELRRRLLDCGAIKEKAKTDEKIEDLLVKVEKGEIPFDRQSEAYRYLTIFIYESKRCYRPEVRRRLEKAGKISALQPTVEDDLKHNPGTDP